MQETPGSVRSPAGGHGNPPQYSCLDNPMDRGTWWSPVHGVKKESYMTEHAILTPSLTLLLRRWAGGVAAGPSRGQSPSVSLMYQGSGMRRDSGGSAPLLLQTEHLGPRHIWVLRPNTQRDCIRRWLLGGQVRARGCRPRERDQCPRERRPEEAPLSFSQEDSVRRQLPGDQEGRPHPAPNVPTPRPRHPGSSGEISISVKVH